MAEKRMFSKKVTDSDAFIEMPSTTQALYFHLNQSADDDGFNNQIQIAMMKAHASTDDLKILLMKNFIIRFESGVIVIKHWRIHNTFRKDRYSPTTFQDELAQLNIKENLSYTLESDGCHLVAERLPQYSIDKISIDKISKLGDKSPARKKYGEYNHVLLTDEQYQKLVADYSAEKITEYIKKIDEYCQQYGKSYKDYNLTIRKWILSDNQKKPERNYDIIPDKEGKIF